MLPYTKSPQHSLTANGLTIASFLDGTEQNLDHETVKSFGAEWSKFHDFSNDEIQKIGDDYFDILPEQTTDWITLDVGCGSGRWAVYLAPKVKFIEAIDPSEAVWSAKKIMSKHPNTRVTLASVEGIPFADNSFDLVYSLGVLHHIPNTQDAIQHCFQKVKSGGYFLLYLYYNLDNRGNLFKILFKVSAGMRKIISTLPSTPKRIICDLIATIIYWPLAKLALFISLFSSKLGKALPLSYYQKTSFFIMRNDALDRFGTPLEKRFSKREITDMLQNAGFINITFSDREPYWHAIAQKP